MFNELPVFKKLVRNADVMNRPENHLKHLLKIKTRFETFSRTGAGLFYDFSRQRINTDTLNLLFDLAEDRGLKNRFRAMSEGEKANRTENRAALHMSARSFIDEPVYVDKKNVMPEIMEVRKEIEDFTEKVRSGKICGSEGKPFKSIVVTGIGGSHLGSEFVSTALAHLADNNLSIHYLANVDIHAFGRVISEIDPERTLWIIISKSYTTTETLANEELARAFMKEQVAEPEKHFAAVTGKGNHKNSHLNSVTQTFRMFDFIGGRYSVSSAVGCLPLSLYLGYDKFEKFLKGAHEMDRHAIEAPACENLPLIAALISVWNNDFLGYPAQAIIPYADPLSRLAAHVQQLYMESNGKSVTEDGTPLTETQAGVMIFGEPGTCAQHSFFQMAHQGRPFPIDFIGVAKAWYDQFSHRFKGVTNHEQLWANLIAQPLALAQGTDDTDGSFADNTNDKSKFFPGNRPSSTLVIESLSPENIGRLLAFYEARTIYEGFIWGINPFDQFGVELGKRGAADIREKIARGDNDTDPGTQFYLDLVKNAGFAKDKGSHR
ncbi:glucose-6-phosphate isomerase [Desulfobacterales bacterium HSG16]|nr:glucose-6-phosphate isomerase [Desulfobacterales bacterium HSG16]